MTTPYRRVEVRNPERPIWLRVARPYWSLEDERELERRRLREGKAAPQSAPEGRAQDGHGSPRKPVYL